MPRDIYVFTWNPPHAAPDSPVLLGNFGKQTLDRKLWELRRAIKKVSDWFATVRNNGDPTCIFVAPDYLLARIPPPYKTTYKALYDLEVQAICQGLDDHMLVVAGSIQWVHDVPDTARRSQGRTANRLYVTALVGAKGLFFEYDKKRPAGTERDGQVAAFASRNTTGVFEWGGLRFGIEICQDHEERVLLTEVGGNLVDVHVLLSYGQEGRARNVAAKHNGMFVQCELVGGYELGRTFVATVRRGMLSRMNMMMPTVDFVAVASETSPDFGISKRWRVTL